MSSLLVVIYLPTIYSLKPKEKQENKKVSYYVKFIMKNWVHRAKSGCTSWVGEKGISSWRLVPIFQDSYELKMKYYKIKIPGFLTSITLI